MVRTLPESPQWNEGSHHLINLTPTPAPERGGLVLPQILCRRLFYRASREEETTGTQSSSQHSGIEQYNHNCKQEIFQTLAYVALKYITPHHVWNLSPQIRSSHKIYLSISGNITYEETCSIKCQAAIG